MITKFEQFNEGIKTWASKKLKPGYYGNAIEHIFKNVIKPGFKSKYLTMGYTAGESRNKMYEFNNDLFNIKVSMGGGEYNVPPSMYLNGKDITSEINKNIISDIYNFFDEKYNENDN